MEATIIDVTDDGASTDPGGGASGSHAGDWQPTRAADGTVIMWRADGPVTHPAHAPASVVLCNGIACSTDYWTPLATRLAQDRRVVQWDYRGHGRSSAPTDPAATTIDHVISDLAAVLNAAQADQAVLVGHSFGVQIALEAARRLPQSVAAIVAVAGAAGRPLADTAGRMVLSPLGLVQRAHDVDPEWARDTWRRLWCSPLTHLFARAVGGTSRAAPSHVMRAYYEHVSTRDIDVLLAMMRAMQDHDASDMLPGLPVPLLVLAGDADRLTPLPVMADLALAAPEGELAVCHGGTHTLPIERPDWIVEQVRPLLERTDAETSDPAPVAVAPRA